MSRYKPKTKEERIMISPKAATALAHYLQEPNKGKANALKKAGYPKSMQHNPHKVFNQKGIRMVMDSMGITADYLVDKVKEGLEFKMKKQMSWGEREKFIKLAMESRGDINQKTDRYEKNVQFIQQFYQKPQSIEEDK